MYHRCWKIETLNFWLPSQGGVQCDTVLSKEVRGSHSGRLPFLKKSSLRESPWLPPPSCLELRCDDTIVQQLYCTHKGQSHVTRMTKKNDILMLYITWSYTMTLDPFFRIFVVWEKHSLPYLSYYIWSGFLLLMAVSHSCTDTTSFPIWSLYIQYILPSITLPYSIPN